MGTKREIVVEVEQVRRIRKRVSSQLRFCIECGRHVDFVSLAQAAQLFERDQEELTRFIRINSCHIQRDFNELEVCLVAFLGAIEAAVSRSRIQMIGEMKK